MVIYLFIFIHENILIFHKYMLVVSKVLHPQWHIYSVQKMAILR
jgi:hypothetical protein